MFKILRCQACIFWYTQNSFRMSFWAGTDMLSGSLCSYRLLGVKLLLRTLFWEWRNCLLIVFKKDTSNNFGHPILKYVHMYVHCTYKVNYKNQLLHVLVIYVLNHIFPTSWLALFLLCGKVQSATPYWYIESINLIVIHLYIDIFQINSDILIMKTHMLIVRRQQEVGIILHSPISCPRDSCINIQNFSVVLLCLLNCSPAVIQFDCS